MNKKKLIATSSIALSMIFAFALANADDSVPSADMNAASEGATSYQAPGSIGSPSDTANTTTTTTDSTRTATLSADARTCTDKDGNMYRKDDKGFANCRVEAKGRQAGGTVDSNSNMMDSNSGMMDSQSGSTSDSPSSTLPSDTSEH